MPRYLIVHEGVVRDILTKPTTLIGSDIDGLFDCVVVDSASIYRVGDKLDLQDFVLRNAPAAAVRGSRFIDLKRYST